LSCSNEELKTLVDSHCGMYFIYWPNMQMCKHSECLVPQTNYGLIGESMSSDSKDDNASKDDIASRDDSTLDCEFYGKQDD